MVEMGKRDVLNWVASVGLGPYLPNAPPPAPSASSPQPSLLLQQQLPAGLSTQASASLQPRSPRSHAEGRLHPAPSASEATHLAGRCAQPRAYRGACVCCRCACGVAALLLRAPPTHTLQVAAAVPPCRPCRPCRCCRADHTGDDPLTLAGHAACGGPQPHCNTRPELRALPLSASV